jgi:SAM-dependent methyltransferase
MIERSHMEQKDFVIQSLNEMTTHFLKEEKEQEGKLQNLGHQGLQLYRTFDNLDDIFDLNYQLDRDMDVDHLEKERLYERAGVGVQSGYSTILLALESIDAEKGSKIIDLGSGYGRVGLVCSLLRPDIDFIGYEFVPHRVDISNKACDSLELNESLVFKVQDLSLPEFKIPDADVYYLYDPFTKETYQYVLKQIVEVSKRRKVVIVTKGNARDWITQLAEENSWPLPVIIDEGNLCVFKSQ